MSWEPIKQYLPWLLLAAAGVKWLYGFLTKAGSGFLGVSSYLRQRQRRYVKEVVSERNQLRAEKTKIEDDMEALLRAYDRRVGINEKDAFTIRCQGTIIGQFQELCDKKQINYSHIDLRITQTPNV